MLRPHSLSNSVVDQPLLLEYARNPASVLPEDASMAETANHAYSGWGFREAAACK